MTADPSVVPEARPIARLSYVELLELCHFGAKIVFPPAIHPTRAGGIPVLIRNTFRPEAPCTRVTTETDPDPPAVRGISSIARVALLRLEGEGLIGVPGIAARLFGALAEHDVSVILISQASSEHSICFAVEPAAIERTVRAIEGTFALERRLGMVEPPAVEDGLAIIAVVGAGMRERPGIAGAVFPTLGARRIYVRAIAQGSSELNISLVVSAADRAEAVRALHRTFIGDAAEADPAPAAAGSGAGGGRP
jgi:aspartokinase/homoserine dehydrogenase 1